MRELTREEIEYLVGRLVRLIDVRGIKQKSLEELTGIHQSTISKIENATREFGGERYLPSEEVLTKLFRALGHKLSDILNDLDRIGDQIFGYLATPLTHLSPTQDTGLRHAVNTIREIAAEPRFASPPFEIYWPGDHTHPTNHPDIPSKQVYITDRTRAATHDFIILLCASPSYGVGQENEIATQAGVPAIRLVPATLSRMMSGSFLNTTDIAFTGSLETGIEFDYDLLREALVEIRRTHFRNLAFYKGMNGDGFGDRLRALVDDRSRGHGQFARDLGVSITYLNSLIGESFAVSNPSIRLLKRMAILLGERVSYLIGDTEENDPIWTDSHAAWRTWVDQNDLSASLALSVRDAWRNEYALSRREVSTLSTSSYRREKTKRMTESDWDFRYRKLRGNKKVDNAQSEKLF